jgi:hypothetical protein
MKVDTVIVIDCAGKAARTTSLLINESGVRAHLENTRNVHGDHIIHSFVFVDLTAHVQQFCTQANEEMLVM